MKTPFSCLSAKTRGSLYVGIKYMSLATTVLCVLFLGVVLYSLQRHRFMLHVLLISLFDDLYWNLISLGVLMFLLNGMCFKLNQNLKNQPTNHSLPRTHRVWVGLTLLTLLANALCVSLMARVNAVVDAEIGPRLKHGLQHYLDTPAWGSALDRVQSYLQCCGVHGAQDWYSSAWIPMDRLAGRDVDYKLVQPTGRVQAPLVPSSCCRAPGSDCGHRAWLDQSTKSWADLRPAAPALLHARGCEEAIRAAVSRDFLLCEILMAVVFVLQVVLVVAARYYHTSTLNSVMLGRPQDTAPGWLFGPRLLRRKQRYGYLQEYADRCHNIADTSEPEGDVSSHKSKWKCMKSLKCGKSDISSDTEGHKSKWKCLKKLKCRKSDIGSDTEGTQSTEGGKSIFKPPCLAKLKQLKSPKCMAKLKTQCSKRFKKTKNKDGEYLALESDTPVESETDVNQETEEARTSGSDVKRGSKTKRVSLNESGRKDSPERMRTGGDWYFGHRSSETSDINMTKKISGNLIDVEVTTQQRNKNSQSPKAGAKLLSPSLKKHSAYQRNDSTIPTSEVKRLSKILEPRKGISVVVEDFKRRRALFENSARTEVQAQSVKGESVRTSVAPSVNLIDLDDVESARTLSLGSLVGTSGSNITALSSVKNEIVPRPFILRNYPPLPQSDNEEAGRIEPPPFVLRNYPPLPQLENGETRETEDPVI